MDIEILRKIYDYPKPLALLELRKRVYDSFSICGNNFVIANVGIVNPQQRSLLAILCEEILGIESIDSVMIIGVVDEGFEKPKYLISSFRTTVLAINVSTFIHKIFGKKFGGGRRGAGASKIPLDPIICSSIDFAKRKESSLNNPAYEITSMFYEVYAAKVREEKNNI
jgi:nanoRNase/pAp phosphatase (c-di-AMP/oligoRNAs hydrolase)